VVLTRAGDQVILSTRQGMAIRFDEADARAMGRNTRGVKGIDLREGDEVVGLVVADPEGYLLTVCENGYGKRTPFGANLAVEEPEGAEGGESEEPAAETPETPEGEEGTKDRSGMRYRKQRRGGKGLRDIRTSERNGPVIGVVAVRDGDDIMLITTGGMVNRTHVDEIRVIGRNTQGVRVMNLNEGDKIVSIAKLAREDDEEKPAETPAPPSEGTPTPDTPSNPE
jgi:DNA gyrase subunit A